VIYSSFGFAEMDISAALLTCITHEIKTYEVEYHHARGRGFANAIERTRHII
jgi:hypothetical protein